MIVTADQNLEYQQHLRSRKLAIIVPSTNHIGVLQKHLEKLVGAVDAERKKGFLLASIGKNPSIGAVFTNPLGRRLDDVSIWRSCKSQSLTFQIYFRHPNR